MAFGSAVQRPTFGRWESIAASLLDWWWGGGTNFGVSDISETYRYELAAEFG